MMRRTSSKARTRPVGGRRCRPGPAPARSSNPSSDILPAMTRETCLLAPLHGHVGRVLARRAARATVGRSEWPRASSPERSMASVPARSASNMKVTLLVKRIIRPIWASVSEVPMEATTLLDPGLRQPEHVGVALHHHYLVGLGDGPPRLVQPVEQMPLLVQRPLGGVQVLGRLVRQRPAPEAHHPAPVVHQREHQPAAEAIVGLARLAHQQTGVLQLAVGEPLLGRPAVQSPPLVGRQAHAERPRTPPRPSPRFSRYSRAAGPLSDSHRNRW